MNDPIIDEVRRVRDEHAARFNYDLDAIFRDIKQREQASGLVFIQGVARQPAPNTVRQSTATTAPAAGHAEHAEAARGQRFSVR